MTPPPSPRDRTIFFETHATVIEEEGSLDLRLLLKWWQWLLLLGASAVLWGLSIWGAIGVAMLVRRL